MVSTVSINELEKYADNIYEAIIILAKRARQINEEQKRVFQQESDYDEEYLDYEEEEETETETEKSPEKQYKKLPKPTTIALEEFLAGKIKYDYLEEQKDEEPA
ncbi:MAG: DNA-directed RNA polymerase subunit omega [bacterium]